MTLLPPLATPMVRGRTGGKYRFSSHRYDPTGKRTEPTNIGGTC